MKTFVELITEIRQCIDQEDNKVLANIKDSMESTTVATSNHALGSYLIYDKKVYEVTTAISVGDTLVIYPATGYNIKVADDIMTMIETLRTENQTLTNKVTDISDEIADINNVFGAKNLLPNEATTQVLSGVTFTVNSDGSVTVNVPTNPNSASLYLTTTLKLPAGTYKLTGCPSGGSGTRYYLQGFGDVDYTSGSGILDIGESVTFTLTTTNTLRFSIYIRREFTQGGTLTFYPMIRPASIEDDTYVPYAMTNRDLTEKIDNLNIMKALTYANDYEGWATLVMSGKVGMIFGSFKCKSASGDYIAFTNLPSYVKSAAAGITIRDNTNGALIKAWTSSQTTLNTYLHDGTMVVGNSYGYSFPVYSN